MPDCHGVAGLFSAEVDGSPMLRGLRVPHGVVHDRIVTGQKPASASEVARTAGRIAALRPER